MLSIKDIPGYEHLYAITDEGDVWSIGSKKFLKGYIDHDGYKCVDLYSHNGRKKGKIHRLVLLAFLGASDLQVNHKDGDRQNNLISNLEYCTASENAIHSFRILGRKNSKESIKRLIDFNVSTKKKPVIQLTKDGLLCKIYDSVGHASRTTGICYSSISLTACHHKKHSTAGGYCWEWASKFPNTIYYDMAS